MFLGNSSNLNAALQLVTTRALLLSKGSGAVVAIRDGAYMVCQASIGESAPPVGYRLDASGFSGECVRTGKLLRCDDTENDPRVDGESCRLLGIRSILAAPIRSGSEVVGLLEVFSPEASAFDAGCVAAIEQLAQNALPAPRLTPPPKLLIELEPARRVFFRNLVDTLSPPRLAPLKLTSLPARFWNDVFVPSQVPWQRFRQSLVLHVIAIAMLVSAIELGLFQGSSVRPQLVNQSDVVYFSPEEYLRALAAASRAAGSRRAAYFKPSGMAVSTEKRGPAAVAAPSVRVKSGLGSLQLVAWHAVVPAPPVNAATQLRLGAAMGPVTVVAPAPDVRAGYGGRSVTGMGPVAVVGPPADAPSLLEARSLQAGGSIAGSTGVVGPPPSTGQLAGRVGMINVGHIEVVGPAPQMAGEGSAMMARLVQASLHGPVDSVVPPAPSIGGVGSGSARTTGAVAAVAQAGLPPAIIRGATYPNVPPPAPESHEVGAKSTPEATGSPENHHELSVNFIGLALSLRSSSYFASQEVFLAEDRLSKFQSKLIKLVYEFLPYQPRLSDYGPNYPAVDKLRVTRDPKCDEPLGHVVSSFNLSARPVSERLQQDLKSQPQANTLECYRTTADDYRRARVRH